MNNNTHSTTDRQAPPPLDPPLVPITSNFSAPAPTARARKAREQIEKLDPWQLRRRTREELHRRHLKWTTRKGVKGCGKARFEPGCTREGTAFEVWTWPEGRARWEEEERAGPYRGVDVLTTELEGGSELEGELKARYAGICPCGARICWLCGSSKLSAAAARLALACELHLDQGGGVYLLTLTQPHQRHHSLSGMLQAQSRVWARLNGGRGGQAWRRRYGGVGYYAGLDITHGERYGWHPHRHVVLFTGRELKEEELEELEAHLYGAWADGLEAEGYSRPYREFCRLEAPRAVEDVARYAAQACGLVLGHGAYALAREAAATVHKSAHAGHRTVGQIFFDACAIEGEGEREARRLRSIELAREVEAHKGRWWSASRDVRELLTLAEEMLDQVDERPPATLRAALPRWVYAVLLAHGWRAAFLELAEAGGEGLDVWRESLYQFWLCCPVSRAPFLSRAGDYWSEERSLPPPRTRRELVADILRGALATAGLPLPLNLEVSDGHPS